MKSKKGRKHVKNKRSSHTYQLTKNKFLSDTELEHLRKVLKEHPGRDAILIEFALATGARANEILGVRLDDLNVKDKSVFIKGLKNSKDREIPLKPRLFQQVFELAQSSESGTPFDISYPRFNQIWQIYRPVKKVPHCLRHTFAIKLFAKHKDLRLVQVALGHRNISNTMIYADYHYSKEELRRLIA